MERQSQGVNSRHDLLQMIQKLIDPDFKKRLPKEYGNTSPIDALVNARAWVNPIYDTDDGPKYEKLIDELDSHYNDLIQTIPTSKLESFCDLINKYWECALGVSALEQKNTYEIGLRDGFLLAVELLAAQRDNKAINRSGLMDTLGGHRKAL